MQKFAALIRDADGELIPTLPAWRVIGNVGVVNAAGRFVATAIGAGEVEAIAGGLSARCQVTVSPGSVVRVEIQPDSLSIKAGEQQRFSVISRDEAGNLVDEPPAFHLTGDLGTIDDRGFFTAQNTGAGSVMAFIAGHQNVGVNLVSTQNPVFTQADIEVLPGDLSQVVIVPVDQSALAGSSVRFAAIGKDAHGNVIPVDPAWDIDGNVSIGRISSN